MILRQPLIAANRDGQFDVICTVIGGGLSGQAGAVRHGISKALISYEPALRPTLKTGGFLTRDSRVVERKKYGRPKRAAASSFRNADTTLSLFLRQRDGEIHPAVAFWISLAARCAARAQRVPIAELEHIRILLGRSRNHAVTPVALGLKQHLICLLYQAFGRRFDISRHQRHAAADRNVGCSCRVRMHDL